MGKPRHSGFKMGMKANLFLISHLARHSRFKMGKSRHSGFKMGKLPDNFGALKELKRAKKMFKNIIWEWDKYRKHFVKEDIDPSFKYLLKLLLQNAEVEEKNDFEASPEDGPFLGNHKEYASSSTLEAENNNVIEKSLKTLTKHPQVRMRPLTKIKKNAKK